MGSLLMSFISFMVFVYFKNFMLFLYWKNRVGFNIFIEVVYL